MAQSGSAQHGEDPLVCVMMAAHDAERYLTAAVESVLAQSYPRFELLVVDDGSTDGTLALLEQLAQRDARVRVLRNERNLGVVATRNRMLGEAPPAAKYLAVLDADDVCLPQRLARQVAFLEQHPRHALVGCHTQIIDEQGRPVGLRRYPTSAAQIRRVITRYNPIAHPGAMLRRSAVNEVGPYDADYPRCQDYELWLRLAERYDLANLDEVLIGYRISATQVKQRHLRESLRLTVQIQRRWLFSPRFFNPFNVLYWLAEHVLLALPDALVLGLFKRLTYRSGPA